VPSFSGKGKKILILHGLMYMFIPLILFCSYRTICMAGLACRGARGAISAAAASSSGGFDVSYNKDDARRYLRWWKGTRDLYSEATREIVRLQLCLEVIQATLTAAEGEASTARALLSTADGRVAGTVLLFEHN
jgi:hypothetical protein